MLLIVTGQTSKQPGRPLSFNRDQALERAMQIFWAQGYEGSSLHDLTTAMGIKPASLYAAFGNKQALFEQALKRYLTGPVAFMQAALNEPTAYAVAEQILTQTAEFLTRRRTRHGCMTIQAALTCSHERRAVRRKLIALRVSSQEELRQRFERAKLESDLPDTADAAELARFITTIFQGMTVQAINGATRQELLTLAKTALRVWP